MKTGSKQYYEWKRVFYYNDPGRFDVCRGCPLKMAMLQKKCKEN